MNRRTTKDSTPQSAATNRRDFLKTSALVAGYGVYVASATEKTLAQQSPNERVNVAWVGVGGKGDGDSTQVSKVANLVAVCDTDSRNTTKKAGEFQKGQNPKELKVYSDWRKLLEEMDKDIDAVGVSIPDHNHAMVAIHAMKMGKHVYCQKPLTHCIAEARAMRETAAEHKVMTQMGNQGTASGGLRTGVEVIQAGLLGKVQEVHIWTNRPIWPQAPDVMEWPAAEETPKEVNWDVWLGPAPEHPFSAAYSSFKWRGYWDFGTGAMGDMGCHTCNMPFMALKMGAPTRVKGVCADLNPVTYPAWATVEYDFPSRGDLPALKSYWYEGHFGYIEKTRGRNGAMAPNRLKNLPPLALFKGQAPSDSGSLTVGEKGTLYSPQDYGGSWKLLGNDGTVEMEYRERAGITTGKDKAPPQTLPRFESQRDDDNMKLEWVNAIKGKGKTLSNFDYASRLVEFILLGNIANRVPGQPLDWDTESMTFKNNKEADRFVKFEYRQGWSL